ncbi:MAG: FABP family protein [Oligoflexia bacterium]|nr:FABP family protein [Oligoflexia bacterium]
MNHDLKAFGPLAHFIGTWEGKKGDDKAPDDHRTGTETNKYRELVIFEPLSAVNNHEQTLQALKYSMKAWRLTEADPFHEEVGYWLWDSATSQIMKCFTIPRGIALIAGGTARADSKAFSMKSEHGSSTYGVVNNAFLEQEFKIVRYTIDVSVHDQNSWSYKQNTELQINGQSNIFNHTDENSLTRK